MGLAMRGRVAIVMIAPNLLKEPAMTDMLIRGLDDRTLKRLKVRAQRHGRSPQAEAKLLLEQAAGADREQVAAMLDRWKQRFAERQLSDSTKSIREDRQR